MPMEEETLIIVRPNMSERELSTVESLDPTTHNATTTTLNS